MVSGRCFSGVAVAFQGVIGTGCLAGEDQLEAKTDKYTSNLFLTNDPTTAPCTDARHVAN